MIPNGLVQPLMAVSFAIPCFTMGFRLLQVWRDPMSLEEGRWVSLGIGVFVLEFILTHAGIFLGAHAMGATSGSVGVFGFVLLVGFYALFAGAIALAFKSHMLFMSFLGLVVGRLAGMVIGMSNDDQALFMAHSVIAAVVYFVMVFASVFLPWPRRGITPEIAARSRTPGASGLWVEQPPRALGPAAVYLILLGVIEVLVMTWINPHSLTPS